MTESKNKCVPESDDDTMADHHQAHLHTHHHHHQAIDCLQGLQQQPAAPFHYLISEQAKSLVALQELQHEVGALLEFRDLVIATFPNLRHKFTASSPDDDSNRATSPPLITAVPKPMTTALVTSTNTHHHLQQQPYTNCCQYHTVTHRALLGAAVNAATVASATANVPITIRTMDWTPGVRVRRKINSTKEEIRSTLKIGSSKKTGDSAAIQDSGFSTETSSKETHSASSTVPQSSANAQDVVDVDDDDDDELWHLLNIIHTKSALLKEEVNTLQDAVNDHHHNSNHISSAPAPLDPDCRKNEGFQQVLFQSSTDEVRQLQQERDLLLDRLAEMEAEVLAGRVHTTRLQEDLEYLLTTKHDLEEQLKAAVNHSGEVNSRIHDLHLQFVAKGGGVSDAGSSDTAAVSTRSVLTNNSHNPISSSTTTAPIPSHLRTVFASSNSSGKHVANSSLKCVTSPLDVHSKALFDDIVVPKVKSVDKSKFADILAEHNPLILQRHLLTTTVQNQVLQEKLNNATRVEIGLANNLVKTREENDDLRFQLEDKNIELEGTKARVRLLEHHQHKTTNSSVVLLDSDTVTSQSLLLTNACRNGSSQAAVTTTTTSSVEHSLIRNEITTASMKAMSPIAMNLQLDHSSSTESAHDAQAEHLRKGMSSFGRRKPSKIPLMKTSCPTPKSTSGTPPSNTPHRSMTSHHQHPHYQSNSRSHSWRNRTNAETNNSFGGSGSLSATTRAVTALKSRNGSLVSARDSLSTKLRNSDSLSRLNNSSNEVVGVAAATTANASSNTAIMTIGNVASGTTVRNAVVKKTSTPWKWTNSSSPPKDAACDKVRQKSTPSFWNIFKLHNAQT